jgi:hypothetical protein
MTPKDRGRIPKWCSAACRQRAWEQARAAASGRSAVEVVERLVRVPVEATSMRMPATLVPASDEWPRLIESLAGQIRHGQLPEQHLSAIRRAVGRLNAALAQHG